MRRPTLYVAKDGTKTWRVRYRDAGGRQTSETFFKEANAKRFSRWLADYGPVQALELQAQHEGEQQGHTVESWCTHHIDKLTGNQDDTLEKYQAYVRNDLWNLRTMQVTAVSEDDIGDWVKAMQKAGASGKTIKNKHGFLSAAFDRAEKKELIPANPCRGTTLPRTVTEPMTFLTHEEYTLFLDFFTPHWQPLVTTLFATGLRWSEATALQVGDVDLHRRTATVARAWKRGGKLGPPKSRKSARTVALSDEVVDVLRPLCEGRPANAWLFVNQRGGIVRHATFHDNAWQPAVRLANGEPGQRPGPKAKRVARRRDADGKVIEPASKPLGKRPRIHDARHSNASWLLADGLPLNVVQYHLGHESITTTSDRYGHLLPSSQAYVRDAISRALSPAHPQIEA